MKTIFLDRDGTLIHAKGMSNKIEDFSILPGVTETLHHLAKKGYTFVICTNQGGVALGIYTIEQVEAFHRHLTTEFKKLGITFLEILYSPDHNLVKNTEFRKPNPGMLLHAAEKHRIDLQQSWMIGDRETDVQAGIAAKTKTIKIGSSNRADFEVRQFADIQNIIS